VKHFLGKIVWMWKNSNFGKISLINQFSDSHSENLFYLIGLPSFFPSNPLSSFYFFAEEASHF
jgi:hypothetical protein